MVSKITLALKKRAAPERGIMDSNMLNDIVNEVSHDLIDIVRQWNSIAYPIFSSLPQGESDTRWVLNSSLNPFVNGLDGTQMFMDNDASAISDDGRFWDSTNARPKTIKEITDDLKIEINDMDEAIQRVEIIGAEGLTEEQKARIGLNIFNPFQTSSSDSLDGKTRRAEFNIVQLAGDLYGPVYTLDGDGLPNLANSVQAMVNPLLVLHNGSWDTDVVLSHTLADADIIPAADIAQSKIAKSSTYTGVDRLTTVNNLEDDLNRLRYELGRLRGNSLWNSDFSNIPYSGAPYTLQGHVETVGTGTPGPDNPHGLTAADIGLADDLAAIVSFTGMNDSNDLLPDYANNYYVGVNDPLEMAIGKLDAALNVVDGENDAHRAITNGNPHGVDMDDFAPNTVISRINLATNYIDADRLTNGIVNAAITLTQEANWDGHLITVANAHPATAIDVNDLGFVNFNGITVQAMLANIDAAFTDRRLEVTFTGHTDETPILVIHNKGRYPIVQLIDTSEQVPYPYDPSAFDTDNVVVYTNIEHIDNNSFRVWTNSSEGLIVALF